MSTDQQAGQLDNVSETPSESKLDLPQKTSPDVYADADAMGRAKHLAGTPTKSVDYTAGISPTVNVQLYDECRREVEERPKIREVALLADELPIHIFSADSGLSSAPPAEGQLLVLTNQRLIAFCHADGKQAAYLVPINEVKHVSVKAGSRSASMLLQGSLMVVAGIFIYLVLGYWLTNQIASPTIPVLHMDVVPFIALIVALIGLTMIVQVYFTKTDGTVTVQGDGLQFVFPFHGVLAQKQIFDVVNTTFEARQTDLQEEASVEVAVDPPPGTADGPA